MADYLSEVPSVESLTSLQAEVLGELRKMLESSGLLKCSPTRPVPGLFERERWKSMSLTGTARTSRY